MKYLCPTDRGENVPQVRDEVAEFAVAMEQKLRKKDGKTHWRERPIEALKRLMLLEVEEFKVAHEFFGPDEAMDELRDIANYAMILWDRIRIEKEQPKDLTGPVPALKREYYVLPNPMENRIK